MNFWQFVIQGLGLPCGIQSLFCPEPIPCSLSTSPNWRLPGRYIPGQTSDPCSVPPKVVDGRLNALRIRFPVQSVAALQVPVVCIHIVCWMGPLQRQYLRRAVRFKHSPNFRKILSSIISKSPGTPEKSSFQSSLLSQHYPVSP